MTPTFSLALWLVQGIYNLYTHTDTHTHMNIHTPIRMSKQKVLNDSMCVPVDIMVQLVKCPLFKHGDLISDPQHAGRG